MNIQDDDEQFDARLRGILAGELDPQLGRARRAFERHVSSTSDTRRRGGRSWVIGLAGAALAASLAAVWVVPKFVATKISEIVQTQPGVFSPAVAPDVRESATEWEPVERVVSSRTLEDGLVVLDDKTPARFVRQVAMERTQWVDPKRGIRVEAVVPREKVTLIAMDTY